MHIRSILLSAPSFMPTRAAACFMMMLGAATGGCGPTGRPQPERFPVKGMVTLDGEPLADGRIEFKTISTGYIDGMPVKNGVFAGRAVAGDRRVEFSVMKQVPFKGAAMPGTTPPDTIPEESLPKHLNVNSTFSATVSPTGPNEFRFELTSQPPK